MNDSLLEKMFTDYILYKDGINVIRISSILDKVYYYQITADYSFVHKNSKNKENNITYAYDGCFLISKKLIEKYKLSERNKKINRLKENVQCRW